MSAVHPIRPVPGYPAVRIGSRGLAQHVVARKRLGKRDFTHLIGWADANASAPSPLVRFPRDDRTRVLTFAVDDVSSPLDPNGPAERHVQLVVDLGRTLKPDSTLFSHCEMGIRRSTASAIVALTAYGIEELNDTPQTAAAVARLIVQIVRPQMRPNPLILFHGSRLLGVEL